MDSGVSMIVLYRLGLSLLDAGDFSARRMCSLFDSHSGLEPFSTDIYELTIVPDRHSKELILLLYLSIWIGSGRKRAYLYSGPP